MASRGNIELYGMMYGQSKCLHSSPVVVQKFTCVSYCIIVDFYWYLHHCMSGFICFLAQTLLFANSSALRRRRNRYSGNMFTFDTSSLNSKLQLESCCLNVESRRTQVSCAFCKDRTLGISERSGDAFRREEELHCGL